LVEPQNQGGWFISGLCSKPLTFCSWFKLKTTGMISPGLISKPVVMVCLWFSLKITGMVSPGLVLKSVVTVCLGLALKPVASDFSV
jgi:hypothetical protein